MCLKICTHPGGFLIAKGILPDHADSIKVKRIFFNGHYENSHNNLAIFIKQCSVCAKGWHPKGIKRNTNALQNLENLVESHNAFKDG